MRRVVTGLNAAGKSCVVIEDELPPLDSGPAVVWRTAGSPADNSGKADTAAPFDMAMFHDGGSTFLVTEVPAGYPSFMHATDTIDYLVVLKGELIMELETGDVRMAPGTFIVDRGVIHSWRNDGNEPVLLASVVLPAQPVGKGRTV